jgi:hypothetical protein
MLQGVSMGVRDAGGAEAVLLIALARVIERSNRDNIRRAVGGNQVGTLLIRIRATVALDVQSDLNSQAAGVWSNSQPISEPRLSRESCSLCDLGGQQVIGASPARHVCASGDSADRQTVQSSCPSVGTFPSDKQSAFASSSRWVGTLLIGVCRWRTAADLARSRDAILRRTPAAPSRPQGKWGLC